MSVIEKELPFSVSDMQGNTTKDTSFQPQFYDTVFQPVLMYKSVMPFEIKTSIHNCFACDHMKYNKPLELSNFDASVMVIGETPSDIGFQTSEGKLLAETLKWAKYDLEDVYFTSLIKCDESSTPDRCQHHLLSELLCVQPRLVIALGYDVGKHFDPQINAAGYQSCVLDKYDMITTYRTSYTMNDQNLFQDFCQHILRAKQRMESLHQRSS